MKFEPLTSGAHDITPAELAQKIEAKLEHNKKKGWQTFNPLMGSGIGGKEVEIAAARLIFFCIERGKGWQPLTKDQLREGTQEACLESFVDSHITCMSILVEKRWLVHNPKDDLYYFTEAFITTCDNTLTSGN
jgi:hypothetical protein